MDDRETTRQDLGYQNMKEKVSNLLNLSDKLTLSESGQLQEHLVRIRLLMGQYAGEIFSYRYDIAGNLIRRGLAKRV